MLISSDPCGGLQQPPVHPPRSNPSVAALDVIDVGQHETAVEQLERVLQVLRNSEPPSPVARSRSWRWPNTCRFRLVPDTDQSTLNAVQPMGTVQLRRRLGTRRISPKVPTAACSNVIIAQREARNVRISFQLSMTIKLDPPGSRQGVPVSDPLAGTPQPRGRHRCWGANSLFLDRLGCSNPDRHDTQAA